MSSVADITRSLGYHPQGSMYNYHPPLVNNGSTTPTPTPTPATATPNMSSIPMGLSTVQGQITSSLGYNPWKSTGTDPGPTTTPTTTPPPATATAPAGYDQIGNGLFYDPTTLTYSNGLGGFWNPSVDSGAPSWWQPGWGDASKYAKGGPVNAGNGPGYPTYGPWNNPMNTSPTGGASAYMADPSNYTQQAGWIGQAFADLMQKNTDTYAPMTRDLAANLNQILAGQINPTSNTMTAGAVSQINPIYDANAERISKDFSGYGRSGNPMAAVELAQNDIGRSGAMAKAQQGIYADALNSLTSLLNNQNNLTTNYGQGANNAFGQAEKNAGSQAQINAAPGQNSMDVFGSILGATGSALSGGGGLKGLWGG